VSALSLPVVVLAMVLGSAWVVAAVVFPLWTGLVRRFGRLSRWSLLVAALPVAAAFVVGIAALLPGDPHLGQLLGCHCLTSMPGWLHLCPLHPAKALGLVAPALVVLGLLLPGRFRALYALSREPLGQGGGPTPMDLPNPTAMLVGWLRPTLVVDRDLWATLDSAHRDAILAHERAHLTRRDPLVLMAIRVLSAFGPLPLGRALTRAWLDRAELKADAIAARQVGATELADALVRCARLASNPRPMALCWNGGALEQRVHALLDDGEATTTDSPDVSRYDAAILGVLVVVGLSWVPSLHHQVEHLINLSF